MHVATRLSNYYSHCRARLYVIFGMKKDRFLSRIWSRRRRGRTAEIGFLTEPRGCH